MGAHLLYVFDAGPEEWKLTEACAEMVRSSMGGKWSELPRGR